MSKKIGEEISQRAKMEVDYNRSITVSNQLKELAELKKKDDNVRKETKEDKKCLLFERGQCKYGAKCKFSHPEKDCYIFQTLGKCSAAENCKDLHVVQGEQADCYWWTRGSCYNANKSVCSRGLHLPEKYQTVVDHQTQQSQQRSSFPDHENIISLQNKLRQRELQITQMQQRPNINQG